MHTFAPHQNPFQRQQSLNLARPGAAASAANNVHPILSLQRTVGNQAVKRLLQAISEGLHAGSGTTATARFGHRFGQIPVSPKAPAGLQTTLTINTPGDPYEQEADRVADLVMRGSAPPAGGTVSRSESQLALQHSATSRGGDPARAGNFSRQALPPTVQISPVGVPLMIQREEVRPIRIEEGAERGGLQPGKAPKWAVPMAERMSYDPKRRRYKDSGAGKEYSETDMQKHKAEAEAHKKWYAQLVVRLQKRAEGKPDLSADVAASIQEEWRRITGRRPVEAGSTESRVIGLCTMTIAPDPNPFLVFPLWQHESLHQRTCTDTYNKALQAEKSQGVDVSLGMRLAAQETVKTLANARFVLEDEIRAYKGVSPAIEKELSSLPQIMNPASRGRSAGPKGVQRKSVGTLDAEPALVDDVTLAGVLEAGQPLAPAARAFFEPRFGHDFSRVRVHTDSSAAESARAVNALAYTVGRDIVFGARQYAPDTMAGRRLLAHELTHAVQQSGDLRREAGQLTIADTTDACEQEAEAASRAVDAGEGFRPKAGDGVRISRQKPDAGAGSAAAAAPSISDCTKAQKDAIEKAIKEAQSTWLPNAITALSASPLDPKTVALLDRHFKTHSPKDVAVILNNFKKIQTSVGASSRAYECEGSHLFCAVGSAWTYCRSDTTHICMDVFDMHSSQMTRTVIHETGHNVGLCEDVYWDDEAKYKKMSAATAMSNPDSYALFAGELSDKL